jgi:hypothetical protein
MDTVPSFIRALVRRLSGSTNGKQPSMPGNQALVETPYVSAGKFWEAKAFTTGQGAHRQIRKLWMHDVIGIARRRHRTVHRMELEGGPVDNWRTGWPCRPEEGQGGQSDNPGVQLLANGRIALHVIVCSSDCCA